MSRARRRHAGCLHPWPRPRGAWANAGSAAPKASPAPANHPSIRVWFTFMKVPSTVARPRTAYRRAPWPLESRIGEAPVRACAFDRKWAVDESRGSGSRALHSARFGPGSVPGHPPGDRPLPRPPDGKRVRTAPSQAVGASTTGEAGYAPFRMRTPAPRAVSGRSSSRSSRRAPHRSPPCCSHACRRMAAGRRPARAAVARGRSRSAG